jgi:hypothetical protein
MSEKDKMDPANRLGLDYVAEAASFRALAYPIIDAHLHLNGTQAVPIYKHAAELYGVQLGYSMTRFDEMEGVQTLMGDGLRFIAMPNYRGGNLMHVIGRGHIEMITHLHKRGLRVVKFWSAPRRIDLARQAGLGDVLKLDAPHILEVMAAAHDLGMIFMVHVADPDTWFAAKYADSGTYGTKASHYETLEPLLERFDNPWIAAHMGGSPEHLDFLSGLLERHRNLYLDTGAAKWMVRELSRHSRRELLGFFTRWKGRILFGSDIVTSDEHLAPAASESFIASKASSPDRAFTLYASRYWAYRTFFETEYDGESPIADPDLAMMAPDTYQELDAPRLRGVSLPDDLLYSLYCGAAQARGCGKNI